MGPGDGARRSGPVLARSASTPAAVKQPLSAPLPEEPFETGRLFPLRVT
ncbi:hypothetical protein [Streptomyces sp. NPDC060131]